MNILGISGIQEAMPFKRAHWPGLDEREYRMSQGHDSAAACVVDGKCVAAAAEERFTRSKHTGRFPENAIDFCLRHARLTIEDIDEIVHCFDYAPYAQFYSADPISAQFYSKVLSPQAFASLVHRRYPEFPAERIRSVNHHACHGASAYFTSGWDECLVFVSDGMGEAHSASVYTARDGKLQPLKQISAFDSIGILYSLVTFHLGFDFNADEYKIMGLAPYGDPSRFRSFFEQNLSLDPNGSLNIPLLRLNKTRLDAETWMKSREYLAENLLRPRHPDSEITDEHRDVAASLQECLDRVMLHIAGHFGKATGLGKLALAGGVALNCTANGRLLREGAFEEIYIQPAAGDDGAALGAALFRSAQRGSVDNRRMPVPYLGPFHCEHSIDAALRECAERIDTVAHTSVEDACQTAAELIASGKVLAWYRGRMEFGPRALGNRSIVADPGCPDMRDRINSMVKMREAFRPFAPAVSVEQSHLWFEMERGMELPYMIMTADVRRQFRSELPAITHVNGSARVQTVRASENPEFHALLRAVGRLTGREMVLNTSFNVKGQPIVNTPLEALETFLSTGIDYLFLENTLVRRRQAVA
jgi:carbamoyltransferase